VKGSGRLFSFDLFEPGILAWWLVEMAVHTEIAFGHAVLLASALSSQVSAIDL
jgi:hypothetical protein